MGAFLVLIKMRYNREGKTYEGEYGKERAKEIKSKISKSLKGRRIKHLKKIGFKKGYIPWNKGKKTKKETIEKLRESHRLFRHTDATKIELSKMRMGKNNPRYKNGIGGYRKKAFKLLLNKCNRCGVTNKKVLIVHHKNYDRTNNSIDNLEILCLNCHSLEHDFNPVGNLGNYAVKGNCMWKD